MTCNPLRIETSSIWQYIDSLANEAAMPRQKNEMLTIRSTAEMKHLLHQAEDGEQRSVASMIGGPVRDYAKKAKLQPALTSQNAGEG